MSRGSPLLMRKSLFPYSSDFIFPCHPFLLLYSLLRCFVTVLSPFPIPSLVSEGLYSVWPLPFDPSVMGDSNRLHSRQHSSVGHRGSQTSSSLHGVVPLFCIAENKQNKLRGLWSASKLYRLRDRHWSANFSANFFG
jgi:hypothetical protein